MRVLIVDPYEQKRFTEEMDPEGPFSFFFSKDLTAADRCELLVLPAALFLRESHSIPENIPVLAYGPIGLISDALAGGCSDYLRDPFSLEELEARSLKFWRLRFTLGKELYLYSRGYLEGKAASVRLSDGEQKSLELLLHRLGRPVPRAAFARSLNSGNSQNSRLVDMTLSRLRRLFVTASGDAGMGTFLVAVRNYGYRLDGKPCA